MNKFWHFIRDEAGERVLRLDGPIDEDNLWGDSVTPQQFRDELEAEEGDITVWVNSPGGSVFAAAEIYTMLCDHHGLITVKIDAIAASAASVVAMAGDRVQMSPVSMIMIHDPMTVAMGNSKDMEKAIATLNEVKESIINAYQRKTGLSRKKISQLMEDETWMSAKKAVELGFADEILFQERSSEVGQNEGEKAREKEIEASWQPYSTKTMGQRVLAWLMPDVQTSVITGKEPVTAQGNPKNAKSSETGVTMMFEEAIGAMEKPGETEEIAPKCDETENGGHETNTGPSIAETPVIQETVDETSTLGTSHVAMPVVEKETLPTVPVSSMPESLLLTANSAPPVPMIGMDGKTKDGAMPYELLKKQLEFLK